MRVDEYGWPWYHDDGRHCPFSGYLLDKLVEQGYARWDSYAEGPQGTLIVRDDGIRAVKLEDKGREWLQRLAKHAPTGTSIR